MRCAKCGANNSGGKKFCGKCGVRLAGSCLKCGAENSPDDTFCGDCGAPLSDRVSSNTATSLGAARGSQKFRVAAETAEVVEGERKTVTALFADIKGSMELIESLDPEDASAILDPALKLMMEAVQRYGGYVAQSTGDGIFALFGAPVAYEDHPQRALYSALRMQEEMRRYSTRLRAAGHPPLEARVGVNTGEVVVRSLATSEGHTDYTPIGHSTSLAARMQTLAPTGSVATTEQVRNLCEGYFLFKLLGPTQVKGVSEPVKVYEVTGVGPLRSHFQRAVGRGLTRFVGRDAEMQAIARAAELAKSGHGQIVGVVAEAGVGKSRLFYEFKVRNQPGWMVLEAYSVFHSKASAYLPVIELLHSYFRITSEDDARTRREKLTGRLLALDRALEDTLPYLFGLLGINEGEDPLAQMDAQVRRRRRLDAIKRVLLRESQNQPLMVMFEDLHLIDEETQALLSLLADSIVESPVLLLLNYRPEYRHDWGNQASYTQLRLQPLGRESAEEMLTALVGDNVELAPLKRIIIEKSEGTPFFMEEIVQSLFEDGTLVRDGQIRVTRSLSQLRVPATVQGVLAARIDRLPPEEKELLQTLSVIGKEFALSLVLAVTGRSEEDLGPMLDDLQLAEFIYEQPAAVEIEYSFKHALSQEVAYNTILQERRRALHERVAIAIESLYSSRLAERYQELARHFGRSGNVAKTIDYSIRAGDAAAAAFAFHTAGEWWEEAARLNREHDGDLAQRADILARFGRGWQPQSRDEPMVKHLEEAVAIYERLGMPEKAAEVHARLSAVFYSVAGTDLQRAEEHFRRGEALLRALPPSESLVGLYVGWGWVCIWRVQIGAAFEAATRAVNVARQLDSGSLRAASGALMGACLWAMGRLREALKLTEHAWEEADRINNASAGSATTSASFILINLCDYKAALRWSLREASRPRNQESGYNEVWGLNHEIVEHSLLGQLDEVRRLLSKPHSPEGEMTGKLFLSFWAGDLEAAEAQFSAAVDFLRHAERRENVCGLGSFLALIQRISNHHGKAEELLLEGLSYSVPGGYVAMEMLGRPCLAHVYAEMGRTGEARTQIARCREIMAAGEDWRGLAGSVEWADAALAMAEKRLADADQHFAGTLEIFRRYSIRWAEGLALRDWGRALRAAGRRESAIEKFDEAIELYRRIGAGQPWIDRLLSDKRAAGKSTTETSTPPA
jgi:class 3 adenylate cyclase/tetratricopeptide (TPR) repeat protein